ncbi:MAG: sugar phosphate isomerase/epimerase [Planctomycetes bacterium]|nr:sugar phosphate isomerase/epimerase [Planctomycetota bacterium]
MPPYDLAIYLNPRGDQREEAMRAIADHGLTRIGTDGCPWDVQKNRDELEAFAGLMRKYGLTLQSLHGEGGVVGPLDKPRDGQIRFQRNVLDRARFLGARCVVFHNRYVSGQAELLTASQIAKMGVEKFDEVAAGVLRATCRYAAQSGIRIALENSVPSTIYSTGVEDILPVIERVAEPNLGICLDSGHAHLCGRVLKDEIQKAGQRLFDTHFHDNIGRWDWRKPIGDCDLHLAPGLGTINWPDAVKALHSIGFPGPVVLEGILGPGDKLKENPWKGADTYHDIISLAIRNWRAFERLAERV